MTAVLAQVEVGPHTGYVVTHFVDGPFAGVGRCNDWRRSDHDVRERHGDVHLGEALEWERDVS